MVNPCRLQLWLPFLLCGALSACSGLNQVAFTSIKAAFHGPERNFDTVVRNPAYQYMQVEVPGSASLMVLGYSYQSPACCDTQQLPVQVWYTAKGEVVRLQGNRLLDTTGLNINLSNVKYSPGAQPQQTIARFDVAELGVFNVQVTSLLQATKPPQSELAELASSTAGLHWYSEIPISSFPLALKDLPPTIFGFAQPLPEATLASQLPQAVYGKQCLSSSYCVEWYKKLNEQQQ